MQFCSPYSIAKWLLGDMDSAKGCGVAAIVGVARPRAGHLRIALCPRLGPEVPDFT